MRRRFLALTGLLAFWFVVFVALGTWQVYRYGVRKQLAQTVAARVHAAPVPAPGRADWPRIRAGQLQFLHVRLTGHFINARPTLVYGTSRLGYGYWVMAAFRTTRDPQINPLTRHSGASRNPVTFAQPAEMQRHRVPESRSDIRDDEQNRRLPGGFIVLVNRGWVSQNLPQQPAAWHQAMPPAGEVTLTGLLRQSKPGGGFLRRNRPQAQQWYSRDVAAIAAAQGLPAGDVAPYFVDAAKAPGSAHWPAAGLTVVAFYNESNWYAVVWYLLALGMLLGTVIAVRYERRAQRAAP